MAEKRKDSRGYLLNSGEHQRSDGRYSFSYTDKEHTRRIIYAKSLVELRQKELKIIKEIDSGLKPGAAERMTLNDLHTRYMSQKYNLKFTTKHNYQYMYDRFVKDSFGKRRISTITYTDIKKFYYSLLESEKLKPNTLETIHNSVHPAFDMAVRDNVLMKNPSDGVMKDIKQSKLWVKKKRHSLTIPQQNAFLKYAKEDKQFQGWVPIITVLLGTGMRIGECLALKWEDLDLDKRMIYVKHSLTNRPNGKGQVEAHVDAPKTDAGIRTIPMLDEVYDAFLEEYMIQTCLGFCTEEIDGYSGFIFSSSNGTVYRDTSVNHAIHRIADAYNAKELENAKRERRETLLLPNFSAHHLRHTFATRLCENESNLKVIQSVMGHADIETTMDVYAEATDEKKLEVIANLNGKIL